MIILSVIAGFRLLGIDPDYQNYVDILSVPTSDDNKLYDPFFYLVRNLNEFIFNYNTEVVFFIYAFIGLMIKYVIIIKYSNHIILSFLIFLALFFLLHDYTQIRASVAIGILVFAYHNIAIKNKWLFLFFVGLACCFHLSAIMALPLYYICKQFSVNKFMLLMLSCFAFGCLSYLFYPQLSNIAHNFLVEHTNNNVELGPVKDFNVLNLMNLSHLFIAVLFAMMWRNGYLEKDSLDSVHLKIFMLGVSVYYFFAAFGLIVLSYRISYIFIFVLVFLLPRLVDIFKPSILPMLFVVVYCILNFIHLYQTIIVY